MKLDVIIDERKHTLEISSHILDEGEDFFEKIDRDMDQGWQMSRTFVERPNMQQRCQIAADKLLSSLSTGNHTLTMLMAGYILKRMPSVVTIDIDTHGDMMNTKIFLCKDSRNSL